MGTQEAALSDTQLQRDGKRRRSIRGVLWAIASPTFVFPAAALVAFVLAWSLFARTTDPLLFPSPWRVVRAYGELVSSGRLFPAFLTTLRTLAIGFGVSAIVGILGGVLVGRMQLLGAVLGPYLDALYATPRVVLVPLVIIWFGVGDTGRLIIVFIGTFIPILINTAVGVRNARPDLVEVAKSFGASERELVRHVILPAAVPFVMAGLRIGVGRALIGVVIAEVFLDLTGLGGLIQTDVSYFRVDRMVAVVLILSLLGTLLMAAMGKLESYFAAWR